MNSKFEIILYWSKEDDAFIAEVPELAGCMADGRTYQEALQNDYRFLSYGDSSLLLP